MSKNLTIVPFKKEEVSVEEDNITEKITGYINKTNIKEFIICGYNDEGVLSLYTNMKKMSDTCFALDMVKKTIMDNK